MALPEFLREAINRANELYARVAPKIDVDDSDFFFRLVHPSQLTNGEVNSGMFDDPSMSGDIESLTTVEASFKRAKVPGSGLVKISVKYLRDLTIPQTVKHWPEICNYSHGLAVGQKTKSIQKKIKKAAVWVVRPD